MERQEFLKKAGLGSIALASFGGLVAEDALGQEGHERNFYLVALSGQTATLAGGESFAMSGCGSFSGPHVRGGGEFVHFDGTKIPSRDFLGTGSWKAKEVLSFNEIGTWGVLAAGIIELKIKLLPCNAHAIPATLKIVCNLGPAGIFNDPFQQEGFTLTIPGLTPFSPFTPNIGLTVFSRRC